MGKTVQPAINMPPRALDPDAVLAASIGEITRSKTGGFLKAITDLCRVEPAIDSRFLTPLLETHWGRTTIGARKKIMNHFPLLLNTQSASLEVTEQQSARTLEWLCVEVPAVFSRQGERGQQDPVDYLLALVGSDRDRVQQQLATDQQCFNIEAEEALSDKLSKEVMPEIAIIRSMGPAAAGLALVSAQPALPFAQFTEFMEERNLVMSTLLSIAQAAVVDGSRSTKEANYARLNIARQDIADSFAGLVVDLAVLCHQADNQ